MYFIKLLVRFNNFPLKIFSRFSPLQGMLRDVAFNGKLHPECFITDDSDAERGSLYTRGLAALKVVPLSLSCPAGLMALVIECKKCYHKEHLKHLISVLKNLVYDESIRSFEQIGSEFLQSELSRNNLKCTDGVNALKIIEVITQRQSSM